MKKKISVWMMMCLCCFLFAAPVKTDAAWKKEAGNYYYYNEAGKILKNRWIGDSYVDKQGKRATDGFYTIQGKQYYFDENGIMCRGIRTIGEKTYYFSKDGVMQTGWLKFNGDTYYFDENGVMRKGLTQIENEIYALSTSSGKLLKETWIGTMRYADTDGTLAKGLKNIGGNLYYFDGNGRKIISTVIKVNGITYDVNANGICTQRISSSLGTSISDEMLFFTRFESGSSSYAQTGGDGGRACGKYQFDVEWCLLDFVKYCYRLDPEIFARFQPYINVNKWALYHNSSFYAAWKAIYLDYPEEFKDYQDAFAKQKFYDVAERILRKNGIELSDRPDVVKGAVFSYAIQHGAYHAANAVIAAGITKETSDSELIQKLYQYRSSQYPTYRTRYLTERNLALSILG